MSAHMQASTPNACPPGCPIRPVGITAKKYHFVDARGLTRVLSEHEITQRHIISGLFGDNHTWLLLNFPSIADGEPTGNWSTSLVSGWLKHRALSASFDLRQQMPVPQPLHAAPGDRQADMEKIRQIAQRVADFNESGDAGISEEVRKLALDVMQQCHFHDRPLDLETMLTAPEDEIINDLRVIRIHANNSPGQPLPAGTLKFEVQV